MRQVFFSISFENESQKDEMIQKLKKQEGKPQEASITEGDSGIAGIGEAKTTEELRGSKIRG